MNGRTVSYGHDELGRRTSRTTPSGAVSSWTYDAAGRRTSLTSSGHELSFERDAAGREVARSVGETVTLASTFDELGRLTGQTVTGRGRTLQRRSYAYQADGHLVGIDDLLGGSRHFDLDPAGRVTAVHADGWTETYAYDEAGNQTGAAWPAAHPGQEATGPRSYSGTRITRAGNVRYEHDALGRITLRQKTRLSRKPDTWRYEWDAEDRLTAVTTPDGARWRYRYDPLGRRIAKQRLAADGETILEQVAFVWDGTTLCEETTTSAALPNPVTLTWDYDGLRPIAQTERITAAAAPQEEIDRRFFAIVTDLVGAPTELIDEAGTIAWRTRSTLWGTTAWNADATAHTPLRFPGQYFDPETGLHYNYFRHYDPETARYLTPDPLGLTPAPNPGIYVTNPHMWADPLGLSPCPNGGSWDPNEAPYIYRGVSFADGSAPDHWQRMYQDALEGRAVPHGGHSDVQRHVGGDEGTWSTFTSWTTDLDDVAREASTYGNGPGVVLRIPNADGPGYSRVPGVSYPYEEFEVTLEGIIEGAEISIGGGPWRRPG